MDEQIEKLSDEALEGLKLVLKQAETLQAQAQAGVASYSAILTVRYKLGPNDKVDGDTGVITRAPKAEEPQK